MVIDVRIPPLGESVTEAVVARWLKQDGERVRAELFTAGEPRQPVTNGFGPAPHVQVVALDRREHPRDEVANRGVPVATIAAVAGPRVR